MDPGVRSHGIKANRPGYLWSKYECFLRVGCRDMNEKLAYKTWTQCDGNTDMDVDDRDDNNSPCTLYRRAKKWLNWKRCYFVKIKLYDIKLLQMFNVSTLCMQSIRWLQKKLWYKLISPCMHYLSTNKSLIKKQKVENAVILSKSIFMASNFFMQMFTVSTLCMLSIRWLQ